MQSSSTPKNFFLQAGIIVSLYASIVSFLTFLFNLIDKTFPVNNGGFTYYAYDGYGGAMRFAISTLIVMFPLFIFLSRIYRKLVTKEPQLKESRIRKWLLYFTLFLAGLTIAIDLIVLINSFLRGSDITTGFILKVLVVLVVAIKVFYFYLKDIQGYWEQNQGKAKMAAWAVSAAVVIVIIVGFFAIGSPATQQKLSRDSMRIGDMQSIQWQLVQYYQFKRKLPATLVELNDPISNYSNPVDPKTAEAYKYSLTAPLTFTLCATFEAPSTQDEEMNAMMQSPRGYPGDMSENWKHGEGETCFDRTIDPDLYPVQK